MIKTHYITHSALHCKGVKVIHIVKVIPNMETLHIKHIIINYVGGGVSI